MKLELSLAVVVAAGLGAVGVTIAVGSRVREPTVVANPYEAGLHHAEAEAARGAPAAPRGGRVSPACDLAVAPCVRAAGPLEVALDLAPRPLRTMAELAAAVELRREGAPVDGARVTLAFEMAGMSMGENRRTLAGAGGGRYSGSAVLVRCPSGRKDWIATVSVELSGAPPAVTRFDLRVED
ncbi:MAG TPA: hypothetical protein VLT47_03865 [Anaeromyxobacteraceae bacterium]|nr:hypothetical protein [Anaeromyxobacteraceae bacterium]